MQKIEIHSCNHTGGVPLCSATTYTFCYRATISCLRKPEIVVLGGLGGQAAMTLSAPYRSNKQWLLQAVPPVQRQSQTWIRGVRLLPGSIGSSGKSGRRWSLQQPLEGEQEAAAKKSAAKASLSRDCTGHTLLLQQEHKCMNPDARTRNLRQATICLLKGCHQI